MRSFCVVSALIFLYCNAVTANNGILFLHYKKNWTECDQNITFKFIASFVPSTFQFLGYNLDCHFKEINNPDTRKISEPTTSINNCSVEDELVLESLLAHIQRYPPYTVIYVITNRTTPCNEPFVIDQIMEQIQIKRSEVNFFIDGGNSSQADPPKEYRLISSISNGLIFRPKSFTLLQFAGSKYLRFNSISQKANLLAVSGTENGTYCMKIDSLLKTNIEDMIYSSFDPNEFEIIRPKKPNRTTIVSVREKGAESRMQTITTTEVCQEVRKKLQNSDRRSFFMLRGLSESTLDFNYGFSTEQVRSMNETYRRPINAKSNKIYVSSSDKNKSYEFDHFAIIFPNGTIFGEEIPLEPIPDTDLFVGSFEPPQKEYFFVQVTTYVKYETISRISFTAMNAAEGVGEENHNPMFASKPIFQRNPIERRRYLHIPASSGSNYNILKEIVPPIALLILAALFVFLVVLIILAYRPLSDRSQRPEEIPQPLAIEHARRRARPNLYFPMTIRGRGG